MATRKRGNSWSANSDGTLVSARRPYTACAMDRCVGERGGCQCPWTAARTTVHVDTEAVTNMSVISNQLESVRRRRRLEAGPAGPAGWRPPRLRCAEGARARGTRCGSAPCCSGWPKRSERIVRSTRKPSRTACSLLSPWMRSRSTLATSDDHAGLATRTLINVSTSNPAQVNLIIGAVLQPMTRLSRSRSCIGATGR